MEPALARYIQKFTTYKKIRNHMLNGVAPTRVKDPLLNAPIFSEETGIFPKQVSIDTNQIAVQLNNEFKPPSKRVFKRKQPFGQNSYSASKKGKFASTANYQDKS